MKAKEEPTFIMSKALMDALKHEAKSKGQKLTEYIDDLILVLTCADSKVWEEA